MQKYAVAGQYGPAKVGGQELPGFRQEPSVDPQSQTDTYAAVTFFIDNWRWADVPFYIRTGKRMPKRVTDIAIQFNAPPLGLFTQETKGGLREARPNLLVLRIQPEEGISLRFLSKSPGSGMRVRPVSMDFNYGSSFGERTPTAYETLLVDAMAGDADALHAPGHGGRQLADRAAHSGRLGQYEIRFSELCRRHLGTQGVR